MIANPVRPAIVVGRIFGSGVWRLAGVIDSAVIDGFSAFVLDLKAYMELEGNCYNAVVFLLCSVARVFI